MTDLVHDMTVGHHLSEHVGVAASTVLYSGSRVCTGL